MDTFGVFRTQRELSKWDKLHVIQRVAAKSVPKSANVIGSDFLFKVVEDDEKSLGLKVRLVGQDNDRYTICDLLTYISVYFRNGTDKTRVFGNSCRVAKDSRFFGTIPPFDNFLPTSGTAQHEETVSLFVKGSQFLAEAWLGHRRGASPPRLL